MLKLKGLTKTWAWNYFHFDFRFLFLVTNFTTRFTKFHFYLSLTKKGPPLFFKNLYKFHQPTPAIRSPFPFPFRHGRVTGKDKYITNAEFLQNEKNLQTIKTDKLDKIKRFISDNSSSLNI